MTRDSVYLRHIFDAIAKIEPYVAVGGDAFLAESHRHDATIRQLEVIGEATGQLSGELRACYPGVPWRRIAGLRDVLIHTYMGVDLPAVWEVTQQYVPSLMEEVAQILHETQYDDR